VGQIKNVQISFDEQLLETIDRYATSSRLTRSAVVREAVKTWIRQKEVEEFEDDWIQKLKESPDDLDESEAWLKAEKWSDE
jgi:metal-responsive CopG/Arc/MetJ family transcriptional regulator